MITVDGADYIIQKEMREFGEELVPLEHATGRVLAEDIIADRDIPPYDRVTMDGIAIRHSDFEKGTRKFNTKGIQSAGDKALAIEAAAECVEVMTGAALPVGADTIVRYEDVDIFEGTATLKTENVRYGQNIHYTGTDKLKNTLLATTGRLIDPALINIAASVGKAQLQVKRLPRVCILSSGNELVPVEQTPNEYEVRRSNNYAIASILLQHRIQASMYHIPDDKQTIRTALSNCLKESDVLILTGGVSMGKFDYLPEVFDELDITQLFHKVRQRPGKPFWFGSDADQKLVFAFPGNPVSAFMCMHRYFVPWLNATLGLKPPQPVYAVLTKDYTFRPELTYFLQVKLEYRSDGRLLATPQEGNGSGDFVNLLAADAFMELPEMTTNYKKGDAYRIWPFKTLIHE
ncbi:MAG TPA: molybdopterin molybdotransferase MoeA [Flavipsychrobacter sp.]